MCCWVLKKHRSICMMIHQSTWNDLYSWGFCWVLFGFFFPMEFKGSLYLLPFVTEMKAEWWNVCNIVSGSIQDSGGVHHCLRIHLSVWWEQGWKGVSATVWYSSSKHLYSRIDRKSWRKSILNNKDPLKRGWGSELRVGTNIHDNKWRKRQNGSTEEGNSRNIEQSIRGYTALLGSIWGFCPYHPTGLCKEVWHY